MLCMARALLRQARIVVMDEATAAIDHETDQNLQRVIRTEFESSTVLTIAHRLDTILDSDRILVFDQGRLAQCDTPAVLIGAGSGIFFELCHEGCYLDKVMGPSCLVGALKHWNPKNSFDCTTAIKYQILSVGELVLNIGTEFAASLAKVLKGPADPAKLVQLTKAWNAIKTKPLVETAMKVYNAANRGKTGYHDIEELEQANSTKEDYVRIAALIASLLDPSGVSGVIAAHTYSTCDKERKIPRPVR
ncbi:hypothetical protein H257_04781 [Aphanomyces astaci]|uniref:ABC transporter domain-containing protein n=1 Tax=Aphanomyces astaci TaxID=112090 RepID=W4GVU8_APHAT|nr:hypothetical protein H257_04781 [Aphanomyces astaci]ETV83038.1 hypothetical protein H257_04781 [Aphanomyces astaci]|eukprot:XP_009827709.1 hypothetical protein H257_04781 [Aphanomyces astaci]